ncbi:MAG: DUF2497 domain-containing protein [Pseudomonadota bacterium]
MSASNAAAEPSMEEILSSIRQAINEDIPNAVPEPAGDPFASGSSAEAAFSAPPPGQAFDATVHASHDPFAELTRKLNETRESVQKQMHGVSSTLRSETAKADAEEAAPATPPAEQASQELQPPPARQGAPDPFRAAVFSGETEPVKPETEPPAIEPSGPLQALTARVTEQQADAEQVSNANSVAARIQDSQPEQPTAAPEPEAPRHKPVPELSWASAERSATPAPQEAKPDPDPVAEVTPPAAPLPADEPALEAMPAAEPATDVNPMAKLAAVAGAQTSASMGSDKTDDAMVDLVLRRILEPAVKSWLDENLPRIVTEVVREEVRRVANQPN